MSTQSTEPTSKEGRDPTGNRQSSSAVHDEFKFKLDEAEAIRTPKEEVFANLLNWGMHPEIVFRLERVWDYTKRVGQRIIHIGRLVLAKIIEFIEANPQMCVGAALGAALGALASGIPILGPVFAPVSVTLGAVLGAVVGHDLDREEKGLPNRSGGSLRQTIESLVEIAKEFFRLFIEMVNAVIRRGDKQGEPL
jgi:hypothetical protein